MHSFSIAEVKDRLVAATGGYEIVHESPGLELGVYVLVAPEPDRQSRTRTTRSMWCSKAMACARSRASP